MNNLANLALHKQRIVYKNIKATQASTDMQQATQAKADDEWAPLLVKVAKDRDQHAFAKLFDHFAPKIKAYILSAKSANLQAEHAEELVQEVMVKIWLKAHYFDAKKARSTTWIYTLARNCRTDYFRKANRMNVELSADDLWPIAQEDEPFTSLDQHREQTLAQDAIDSLPEKQASVLRQIYLEGKTHAEVSQQNGIPLGTVKSRARLALEKLQNSFFNR